LLNWRLLLALIHRMLGISIFITTTLLIASESENYAQCDVKYISQCVRRSTASERGLILRYQERIKQQQQKKKGKKDFKKQ
jgi:hypothetical protein